MTKKEILYDLLSAYNLTIHFTSENKKDYTGYLLAVIKNIFRNNKDDRIKYE